MNNRRAWGRASGDPEPDQAPDLQRLRCLIALMLALLAIIVFRLWYLQILKGPALAAESLTQRTRTIPRPAVRGVILDTAGRQIASTRPRFAVSVLPAEFSKYPFVLPRLARLVGISPSILGRLVHDGAASPYEPVPVKMDADTPLLSKIAEQRLDLPGVLVERNPLRSYTDGRACAHLLGLTCPVPADRLPALRRLGYSPRDEIGLDGVEAAYEQDLRGTDGRVQVAVDARGRLQETLRRIEPAPGRTVVLSVNLDLQRTLYQALQQPLAEGHPGSAVAVDPTTGAVLALVSVPSYDPDRYPADYRRLAHDPLKPLINRATESAYPCGSVFKLATAAAGLQSGVVTPYSHDYCSGQVRLGGWVFHCDARRGHGDIDFVRALGASCDVFFWHVAERLRPDYLARWARKLGLGLKTGIDLPGATETAGIVPTPAWKLSRKHETWTMGDTLNMAVGQGFVCVTPLQLAMMAAAIANGGTLWRPHIVREVLDGATGHAVVARDVKPEARGYLGLAPENRDAIVRGMVRAMQPGGTAAASAIPGLKVAGKTGTAEVVINGKHADNSIFVCFAPVDHPRIAIAVVVEGGGHGASTAAPIARRALVAYLCKSPAPSSQLADARAHNRAHGAAAVRN